MASPHPHSPVLGWARTYRRAWLRHDLAAGVALTALLVPQGMAYAQLAGLPPITGLYTSAVCLVGYAVVGPSRVLVLGPDSSLGPMILATTVPLLGAGGDPVRAVVLASGLAVLVGVFMIAAGWAKLGFVADLLSKPTQIGYLNGLALTIVLGQLPKLCGFSAGGQDSVHEAIGFVRGVLQGSVVPAALAIGATAVLVQVLGARLVPRVPGVLLAVLVSMAAVPLFQMSERGVTLIGALPRGFPPFAVPLPRAGDLAPLVVGALGITLVAVTDTISTAAAFARRSGDSLDGNGELVGIGTANLLAGLFHGFPVSTSASRTAVAAAAGSRTQLTGLLGAGAIVLLLVAAPGALADVPFPTLAAIVLVASVSLADPRGLVRLWRQRRIDCALSVAATLGVLLLGVLPGIAVAVALSILDVFRRAWWPYQAILGKPRGVPGFHDVSSYPQALLLPGAVIFRFDAPLFFANARTFGEQVRTLADAEPRPRWIIIAAEPITDVDTTAADLLEELDQDLNAQGTSLVFAELKDPVRAKVERYGLTGTIDPAHFFPTLTAAAKAYRAEFGGDWAGPSSGASTADRLA